MEITKDTVQKVAKLAKLQFNEEETALIQKDLSKMLAFVDQINKVDTEGVLPLTHMNQEANVLREDDVEETITQEQALKNAPQKDSDYFKIPKVLSK